MFRIPQTQYVAEEKIILDKWKQENVFQQTQTRPSDKNFVFFEGPPTANGIPALHHVLARSWKDLFLRYKTMQGYHITRKGGWDTHGLPVEISIEKKLGLLGRNHGATREEMEKFNSMCRQSVFENIQDWNVLTERMGYWVDLENPYITYENSYIESVWNALKRLHEKGFIVQDYKVVPLSPRISSTLSRAELGETDSYRLVDDPSVYVKFPLQDKFFDKQASLLIWTTTPWTLPSNVLAAVNPEMDYLLVKAFDDNLVIAKEAKERLEALHKTSFEVLESFKGSSLAGLKYFAPFKELLPEFNIETDKLNNMHFVAQADFVSALDGSGIVHLAPSYGNDDLIICKQFDTPMLFAVDDHGIMTIGTEKGKFFKDADKGLIRNLKEKNLIFWIGTINHRYPFHDRTGDPILYFAKKGWYIKTSENREEMLKTNEEISWYPAHIGEGRFKKWLEGNVDWAISRERYWGTPLPFWMSDDNDLVVVGSIEELSTLSGKDCSELDLHRPYIDDITFTKDGKEYRRVPEVLDVWFDSGAMFMAQWNYLNKSGEEKNVEQFKNHFPADFICEAIDQTRGWFYSLHAISTLLYNQASYKNVICLGHIVDEHGYKMSKSKGNVVEPLPLFDKYGADAVRWYMFNASEAGDQKRFSERLVVEVGRSFISTIWNVYSFFIMYANLDKPDFTKANPISQRPEIDRWIISRLNQTIKQVTFDLENYDGRSAAKHLVSLVEDLSNWYIRRNRNRFWTEENTALDSDAYATLHETLLTLSKLLAPFMPFVSDSMYRNLNQKDVSVHLANWPEVGYIDENLIKNMHSVIKLVELGRAVRGKTKIKTRQPLQKVVIKVPSDINITDYIDQIKEELNVKEIEFLGEESHLINYQLRPNLPVVGKKYGKDMKIFKEALDNCDANLVVKDLQTNGQAKLGDFLISLEEVLIDAKAIGEAAAEDEGFGISFDINLTQELILEGKARDFVRFIQEARKQTDFLVNDRIKITFDLNSENLEVLETYKDFITKETLTLEIVYDRLSDGLEFFGDKIKIEKI